MTTQESNNSLYPESSTDAASDLLVGLMRIFQIARYRKKIIYGTLCCFAIAGAAYYSTATRYYESSAKLLIVEQKLDRLSAMGKQDNASNTMATHRELVISPIVIKEAIDLLPEEYLVDLEGIPRQDWVKNVASRLHAKNTKRTNFIEVSYRSKHPKAAEAVVNAVKESYLEFVKKNHKGTASEIITVLTEERTKLQESLTTKQLELQSFRQRVGHLAISSDDNVVEPMIQRAIRLNDALLDVQQKRLETQGTLFSIQDSLRKGLNINQQIMSVESAVGKEMLLASMGLSKQDTAILSEQQKKLLAAQESLALSSADLGPNHPRIAELKSQIGSLQHFFSTYHEKAQVRAATLGNANSSEAVVKMLEQAVEQTLQQEKQLLASYELARSEAAKHSNDLVLLHMIERDVIRKEALYDSLSDKIASVDLSQVQAPIRATVVREPYASDRPVTPRLRFVGTFCLVVGTLIGCLIAYVQDVLDDRFNSPEEMSNQLGVPLLAMVRQLDALPGIGMETVHTHAMPTGSETEAFRTLRTSLSLNGDICDRILVSSSEPGDGKTTITANLSVALAQAGNRTLVIDADLRRPGFTALLNLKRQPGVADILSADELPEATAPQLVQHTDVEGLDVLPVGLRRPNPAELLSSKMFVELLAWADSQYDRVIVDCPPVLAVSDAQVVGQLVDGAILVVRPEKNHRRSVIRAVESFHATGCRVLGIVANGLTSDSTQYGYGYEYNYSYGEDEDEAELVGPAPVLPGRDVSIKFPEITPVLQAEEQPFVSTPTPIATPDDKPTRMRPRRAA